MLPDGSKDLSPVQKNSHWLRLQDLRALCKFGNKNI